MVRAPSRDRRFTAESAENAESVFHESDCTKAGNGELTFLILDPRTSNALFWLTPRGSTSPWGRAVMQSSYPNEQFFELSPVR